MPISKKDIKGIKDVFTRSLEPFSKAIQSDLVKIDKRLIGVEGRLTGVEDRLTGVEDRLTGVEADVKWMRENTSELFEKLDRILALFEKHEQELIIMSAQLRRLEDRVSKLETDLKGNK